MKSLPPYIRIAVVYGCVMGCGLCLYTVVMWMTKLDTTYLAIGQQFDKAIILLPIIVIFLAIRAARKTGQISFLQRFILSIVVGLVSFMIYAPFLFAYHNYVNPNWFDAVLELREADLQRGNVDQGIIHEELERMRSANSAQAGILNGFIASVLILPTIICLLSVPVIRNRRRPETISR